MKDSLYTNFISERNFADVSTRCFRVKVKLVCKHLQFIAYILYIMTRLVSMLVSECNGRSGGRLELARPSSLLRRGMHMEWVWKERRVEDTE